MNYLLLIVAAIVLFAIIVAIGIRAVGGNIVRLNRPS